MTPPGLISLVIPVYNERESLVPLLAEIDAAVKPLNRPIEVFWPRHVCADGNSGESLVRSQMPLKKLRSGINMRLAYPVALSARTSAPATSGTPEVRLYPSVELS